MIKFNKNIKNVRAIILTLILSSIGMLNVPIEVNAKQLSEVITGELLEFEKDSNYTVEESIEKESIESGSLYGKLSLYGNVEPISKVNGVNAYEVLDDNVVIKYDLLDTYVTEESDKWHLVDDKNEKVNGEELDSDIGSGAIILQTSLTGDGWITDKIYTDIRREESGYNKDLYTSKDIQQVNGCYYRVLVAYEVEKEEETDKNITNWSGIEKNHKEYAELYKFYLINSSENAEGVTLETDVPRKELGSKINTGKDNGYSGDEGISSDDPHYGWDIGTFFVNGYTRETMDDKGKPVFLKNVGDRVTLWFNLEQDINCLNNKTNLSINEDLNGYDENFEIRQTNLKKGALIIRYTDHEGKVHEPVIYTDYLAANARTGANTKVELFEEGDYEVVLNYEIQDSEGIDSYTNYKIEFEFSIRNGNCMVYPFDTVSGAELTNQNITENGFRLDMARSRYLTIDVIKEAVKFGEGGYVKDERFNRPAKDGEIYSDEGIYTFTVKNLYTDSEPIRKVIYVGTSPEIRAMAKGNTLEEINKLIVEGVELHQDGTLPPVKEEEKSLDNNGEENIEVKQSNGSDKIELLSTSDKAEVNSESDDETANKSIYHIVISIVTGVIVSVIAIILILKYVKNRNNK